MKTTIIVSFMLITLALTSCGGGEEDCIFQCSLLLSKNNNKCRLDNADDRRASNQCSKHALQESNVCQGKCYGP